MHNHSRPHEPPTTSTPEARQTLLAAGRKRNWSTLIYLGDQSRGEGIASGEEAWTAFITHASNERISAALAALPSRHAD